MVNFDKFDASALDNTLFQMAQAGEKSVSGLNQAQQDVAMKYVYAGMGQENGEHYGMLLKWHEELVKQAGIGCIIRALQKKPGSKEE